MCNAYRTQFISYGQFVDEHYGRKQRVCITVNIENQKGAKKRGLNLAYFYLFFRDFIFTQDLFEFFVLVLEF